MAQVTYPCYWQKKDESGFWYWIYYAKNGEGGCPAFLLNIEKRSLPRLMLSGDGLASNDAV